ncbi:MAG: VOC family protein [Myxococcota bacterium]
MRHPRVGGHRLAYWRRAMSTSLISPHLTVRSVEEAVAFYERAFGFQRRLMLPGGPAGKIQHAELERQGSKIMVGPESAKRGMLAPITSGRTPSISLYLQVERVDRAHERALKAGAVELLPPSDQFFGAKTSVIADPNGHQWMLAEPRKEMSEQQMREAMRTENYATPKRRQFNTD